MTTRGIRGATQTPANQPHAIYQATQDLLLALLEANPGLTPQDIGSIFFTVSPDLNAAYPALAARNLGWDLVPMLCAQEIAVPNGMERCIRVLLHWNTNLPQTAIRHVYLGETARLRPDLAVESLPLPVFEASA